MASLSVRRAAEGRRMPWKNGGGDTIEIAVHPAAADLDAADWRVSLAAMTADGPFSAFPGLDRTLVVVQGHGIALILDQHDPVRLEAMAEPFRFPADVACTARLLSGPVTNLNVMTRRARFRHGVEAMALRRPTAIAARAVTLLVCCTGRVAVADRVLDRHDALVSSGPQTLTVSPLGGPAIGVLITIRPV